MDEQQSAAVLTMADRVHFYLNCDKCPVTLTNFLTEAGTPLALAVLADNGGWLVVDYTNRDMYTAKLVLCPDCAIKWLNGEIS